ncbi:hypothetical protein SAY87_004848 [Trapa incisa]|uniref:Uncharacterized protein n=1 Tax=Trapa incisa TaxID=236973 RepID=A0AAN7PN13_9MYRT|nr:hypothetical protein SAY87_004848 [Trapa incisa]
MPSEDSKPAIRKPKLGVEDEEVDGKRSLGSLIKDRNSSRALSSAGKTAKVKKEEPVDCGGSSEKKPSRVTSVSGDRGTKLKKEVKEEDDDDDDDVPISKKASTAKKEKEVNKKKKVKEEPKRKTTKQSVVNGKKREKKVYDLPGQKRDPPEERDPLRIFYESLYKQLPKSEMAQFWMMESGLLPKEEAKKIFEKKQRKAPAHRLSSPAKSASSVKRTSQTTATVKKISLPSSPLSSNKKMTEVKVSAKQVKKRKDKGSDSDSDSDDDFVLASRVTKKSRAA